MPNGVSHLFWDSCVFTAFLRNEHAAYDVNSIEQYLMESRDGNHRIYTSSLVFAEVLPSSIIKTDIGSFSDFVDDFRGAIIIIDASPDVMQLAGRLRDLPYKKGTSPGRRLATPDAIMLASAVYLVQVFGVNIDHFHTYDDGKSRGPEGRSVPLLSYQDWCEGFTPDQATAVKPVLDLDRCRPIHPSPRLPLNAKT
jgi:predicted nucleic acid-binding protein